MHYRILKVQEPDAKDPYFRVQFRWLRWMFWTTWRGTILQCGVTYHNHREHKTMKIAEETVAALQSHYDPKHKPTVEIMWEGSTP